MKPGVGSGNPLGCLVGLLAIAFSIDNARAHEGVAGEEYVLCDCGTGEVIDKYVADLESEQGKIGEICAEAVGSNLEVNITTMHEMCLITETHICNIPTKIFGVDEGKKEIFYDIDIHDTYDFVCTEEDPDNPSQVWGHATVECECGYGWALQTLLTCDTTSGEGCGTCLEQTDDGMVITDTEDPDKSIMWTVGPYNVTDLMANVMSFQFLMESFGCQLEDMEAVAAIDITIKDGGLGEGLSLEVKWTVAEGWLITFGREFFGATLTSGAVTNEPQTLKFELFPDFNPGGLSVLDLRGEFTMSAPIDIDDPSDPIFISLGGTACPGFTEPTTIDTLRAPGQPPKKSAYYDFCVCCQDVETTGGAGPGGGPGDVTDVQPPEDTLAIGCLFGICDCDSASACNTLIACYCTGEFEPGSSDPQTGESTSGTCVGSPPEEGEC